MTTKTGAELIADERRRQMQEEGFTSNLDLVYARKQIAAAAFCYLGFYIFSWHVSMVMTFWPFPKAWWKPKTPERNLIRAGALIAAEIDRIQNDNPSSIPPS